MRLVVNLYCLPAYGLYLKRSTHIPIPIRIYMIFIYLCMCVYSNGHTFVWLCHSLMVVCVCLTAELLLLVMHL